MSELYFEVGHLGGVYGGKIRARLVPRAEHYERLAVRPLRRLVPLRDENNVVTGKRREVVRYAREGEEPRTQLLTILGCEWVAIRPWVRDETPRGLTVKDASACGYRTVTDLIGEWRARHRQSDFANLVTFALGDLRDQDLYLNHTGRAGGDYTRNRHRALDPDAPVLTPEQYEELGVKARQETLRRDADALLALHAESPVQRLRWLESLSSRERAKIRQELRIVDQRMDRAESCLLTPE